MFNSYGQWNQYKEKVQSVKGKKIECGLRINPEYSEIETALYNPCAPFSRFGVTIENFRPDDLDGIDGLHFHTMCEQNSDTLERTIKVVEEKFGDSLHKMKWLNFGGGHHITRPDYDVEKLVNIINYIQDKYDLKVYLRTWRSSSIKYRVFSCNCLGYTEKRNGTCHFRYICYMSYARRFRNALPSCHYRCRSTK